jgi:hypothetical protein
MCLLAGTVGSAAGAPAYRSVEHVKDVGCWEFATPLGTAGFQLFESSEWGTDAWLEVWNGNEIVLARDWDQAPTVLFGADGSVSASIPLQPSGVATVTGTTTAVEPASFSDRFREGNQQYHASGSGAYLAFSGQVVLPGVSAPIAVGPDGCSGSDMQVETFFNQPDARVGSFTSSGGRCEISNEAGGTGVVFIGAFDAELSLDGFVSDGTTETGFYGWTEVLPGGAFSMTTYEWDTATGNETGATGSAVGSIVDTGERFAYRTRFSTGFTMVNGTLLDLEGTLSTSVGDFDLGACEAVNAEVKDVDTTPSGPKPGGKRPVNDLPSGAIAAKPGYRATLSTRGAQVPREADYPCLMFEEEDGTILQVPVEHTVWYTIAGTGGNVTVDTAGSDFDTVVAVYGGAPDAAATVACVDDVAIEPMGRTLQAAATFPTTAGTTYWVQIGGFQEDIWGESHYLSFGNLRIAVR